MSRIIRVTAYGRPAPKGRPRVVRLPNGAVRTYTPRATVAWEEDVRLQALASRPAQPIEGPIRLELTVVLLRPRSAPKRRVWPDRRPDLDNYTKTVLDALNGLYWRDDAQIVELAARKIYGEPPRIEILVQVLGEG